MKKKIALLLIQIFVVAIALVMTVTTYAWYSRQTDVGARQTALTAAEGPQTSIGGSGAFEYEPYKGETGLGYDGDGFGGVDKPYTVSRDFVVTFKPLVASSAVTVGIKSMRITRPKSGETADSATNPEILGCFTFRISIGGETYKPNRKGFIVSETSGEYYAVTSTKTVSVSFTLIFLDEESYANYKDGFYSEVEAFAYSGYSNMRAVFECEFEIGIDAMPSR